MSNNNFSRRRRGMRFKPKGGLGQAQQKTDRDAVEARCALRTAVALGHAVAGDVRLLPVHDDVAVGNDLASGPDGLSDTEPAKDVPNWTGVVGSLVLRKMSWRRAPTGASALRATLTR